mgnify:CR=1 FL=1
MRLIDTRENLVEKRPGWIPAAALLIRCDDVVDDVSWRAFRLLEPRLVPDRAAEPRVSYVVTTAEAASCTCPEFCERDHDNE